MTKLLLNKYHKISFVFFLLVFTFVLSGYVLGQDVYADGRWCNAGQGAFGTESYYCSPDPENQNWLDCGAGTASECIDGGQQAYNDTYGTITYCNEPDYITCTPPSGGGGGGNTLGTVCVASNAVSSWNVSGPGGWNTPSGGPGGECRDVEQGDYSISAATLSGYDGPYLSAPTTQTLVHDEAISWDITYVQKKYRCSGGGSCIQDNVNGYTTSPSCNNSCSVANSAPNAPSISGPATGVTSTNYTYSFVSSDPQGDQIRYGIDWDNNFSVDAWLPSSGYTSSGNSLSTTQNWGTTGTKTFQAVAQDSSGLTSGWTSYSVSIGTASVCAQYSSTDLALGKPVTLINPENPPWNVGPASNLTDGDQNTHAYPGTADLYYSVDLGALTTVARITGVLKGFGYTSPNVYTTSWSIEGKNSAGTWVTIASGGAPNADNIYAYPTFDISKIRIHTTSTTNWMGIYELEANACAPTMTATLTGPGSCTIASGGNSCTATLSWSITNPSGTPTKITASGMTDITVTNTTATPQSGTQSVTVPAGNRSFYLLNGITQVSGPLLVTSTCASGTAWNGSICAVSTGTQATGVLDSNNSGTGNNNGSCSTLNGWAWDPDAPNTPIDVHIYKDGVFYQATNAGTYRADLVTAGKGNGYHGFTWTIPSAWKDGANHSINVYAIDQNGDGNPNLQYSPVISFNCAPTPYSVTVDTTPTIGGSVKSSDNLINCGSTCSRTYSLNASVTLQAYPISTYWKFIGWSGDCSGNGICTLLVNTAKSVTATFGLRSFNYREF